MGDAKREEVMREKNKKRQMTQEEKEARGVRTGEAWERTNIASEDGWYMVCLEANYNEIIAQFEMRKASEVGNVNRKTGHLPTYEHHEMAQRERKIFNSQPTTKKDGDKEADGGVNEK